MNIINPNKKQRAISEITPDKVTSQPKMSFAAGTAVTLALNSRGQSIRKTHDASAARSRYTTIRGDMTHNPLHLGGADNSVNKSAVALNHVEAYTKKPFSSLTEEEIVNESFFQGFAQYLAFEARHFRSTEPLSLNTIVGYLSSAKEEIRKKFRNNPIWIGDGHNDPTYWYTKLVKKLQSEVIRDCINRNIPVDQKTSLIGDNMLLEMITTLMTDEKFSGSDGASARLKLICLWQALGRTGEVALASFETAHWNDVIENLEFLWREEKTGKHCMMSFFCDFLSYKLSFYHALGCYLILGGGQNAYTNGMKREDEWLFPDLAGLKNHSAPLIKLFDDLRKLCPQMDDATRKYSLFDCYYFTIKGLSYGMFFCTI